MNTILPHRQHIQPRWMSLLAAVSVCLPPAPACTTSHTTTISPQILLNTSERKNILLSFMFVQRLDGTLRLRLRQWQRHNIPLKNDVHGEDDRNEKIKRIKTRAITKNKKGLFCLFYYFLESIFIILFISILWWSRRVVLLADLLPYEKRLKDTCLCLMNN